MIDFKGKAASLSLIKRIEAAGIGFCWSDNVPIATDAAAAQAIIDAYTLDDAIAAKCSEVAKRAKDLRDLVIADISPAEMSSWAIKVGEAAKFNATGSEADAPMLAAEAAARGVSLADLVTKVEGKAQSFAALEAVISGVDGKHRDAIKSATTFADVLNYDFSAGWPEV